MKARDQFRQNADLRGIPSEEAQAADFAVAILIGTALAAALAAWWI